MRSEIARVNDARSTYIAIEALLARFFKAFDDKRWSALRECLCDDLFTDYASFRGTPASMVTADAFVEERRRSVGTLEMRHDFLNLRVESEADDARATARCLYAIHRVDPTHSGPRENFFHSYGTYVFGCVVVDGVWKIARITQQLLRNIGNPEIHGGTRTASR